MLRLLTIALLSAGCVIRVVSPTHPPLEDYQNVYVIPEPQPEPIIIRQVIIKREKKRVIVKRPRRPSKYKKTPKLHRSPQKLRKPTRVKPKRQKNDKKKGKKSKLKRGQKMSSPTKPE